MNFNDEAEIANLMLEVDLGPLENFFFYLVLDNVKGLFKIER